MNDPGSVTSGESLARAGRPRRGVARRRRSRPCRRRRRRRHPPRAVARDPAAEARPSGDRISSTCKIGLCEVVRLCPRRTRVPIPLDELRPTARGELVTASQCAPAPSSRTLADASGPLEAWVRKGTLADMTAVRQRNVALILARELAVNLATPMWIWDERASSSTTTSTSRRSWAARIRRSASGGSRSSRQFEPTDLDGTPDPRGRAPVGDRARAAHDQRIATCSIVGRDGVRRELVGHRVPVVRTRRRVRRRHVAVFWETSGRRRHEDPRLGLPRITRITRPGHRPVRRQHLERRGPSVDDRR